MAIFPAGFDLLIHEMRRQGIFLRMGLAGLEFSPAKTMAGVQGEFPKIALSCSKSPEGFSRRTLRLLAAKAVELQYVDIILYA